MSNEISPVNRLKRVLDNDSIKAQFENALQENAGAFVASIIDLYNEDTYLQKCDPAAVAMEALKAATLKLPINKQLGFAYIVPYKNRPQFQIGYKGYIQLAMRTGQYKFINAGPVPEGLIVKKNFLTGEVDIEGEASGENTIGYVAYFELLNGFAKALYMTKAEVTAHAKRYSKSFSKDSSAWKTNFDDMASKTVLRLLLSKFGIMSTEMVTALTSDQESVEEEIQNEIAHNANSQIIDVEAKFIEDKPEQKNKKTAQPNNGLFDVKPPPEPREAPF